MLQDVDTGRLLWAMFGLLSIFGGLVAAIVRWSIRQFEARLAATHKAQADQVGILGKQLEEYGRKREETIGKFRDRFTEFDRSQREQERALMALKVELAHDYVRREDFVRNQTVIEAKIDGLASKLEVYQLRGGAKND
ncbi:MAG: hypothetical protein ACRCWH_09335 [Aeromonas veronii]